MQCHELGLQMKKKITRMRYATNKANVHIVRAPFVVRIVICVLRFLNRQQTLNSLSKTNCIFHNSKFSNALEFLYSFIGLLAYQSVVNSQLLISLQCKRTFMLHHLHNADCKKYGEHHHYSIRLCFEKTHFKCFKRMITTLQ